MEPLSCIATCQGNWVLPASSPPTTRFRLCGFAGLGRARVLLAIPQTNVSTFSRAILISRFMGERTFSFCLVSIISSSPPKQSTIPSILASWGMQTSVLQ
uniref:Uncharacterized protein n=1 Tax=Anguilla anguilla TaxID=7936 RepID=A0A0E9WN60_ANGAN